MFQINEDFSIRIRERRGKLMITKTKAAELIGISRQTLKKIECFEVQSVSKNVYQKIIGWLLKSDY
ncbi:TPA: helix-turn-helix transcriptional regulator [Enterococcus faecium]|uniref:helix-turn-helix domain-containing protein n=1 Tax=Enterococcus TaxID=1350 RepID=UPI000A35595A|nr:MULTISPECIES: helix-turn-helix transcriptional regulator [Enterococcus]EKQ3344693.1 helix-turn-helix transcriptional regulator [Enterococcus faecium]EKQ3702577.1 helix-turn-helix transcriptional regulator [Enterococcus faecium]MBG0374347.1 helix-turn-helix transcriptional regulator [Enterococcus faecium]MBG0390823.1 helix-turn-helix transcriptional regulator [Enterococcus faecium]MBG8050847.1 helix-turn-helix transcriptional regulator [Enterococcus faecium]